MGNFSKNNEGANVHPCSSCVCVCVVGGGDVLSCHFSWGGGAIIRGGKCLYTVNDMNTCIRPVLVIFVLKSSLLKNFNLLLHVYSGVSKQQIF